jgi:hypothetical protein
MDKAGVLISHRHLPVPPYETIKEVAIEQSRDRNSASATEPN